MWRRFIFIWSSVAWEEKKATNNKLTSRWCFSYFPSHVRHHRIHRVHARAKWAKWAGGSDNQFNLKITIPSTWCSRRETGRIGLHSLCVYDLSVSKNNNHNITRAEQHQRVGNICLSSWHRATASNECEHIGRLRKNTEKLRKRFSSSLFNNIFTISHLHLPHTTGHVPSSLLGIY